MQQVACNVSVATCRGSWVVGKGRGSWVMIVGENQNNNNNNNTNPVFDAKVPFAQRVHCILLVFELYVPAGQLQDHKQLSLILQCVW